MAPDRDLKSESTLIGTGAAALVAVQSRMGEVITRQCARQVVAVVAAGLLWVATIVLLALPWVLWRSNAAQADPSPGAPVVHPSATWHYSVLDPAQQPADQLPTWVQQQNSDLDQHELGSTRRLAVLPSGGVYITGDQNGGCVVVVDALSRSTGWGCGTRPREPNGLVFGSSLAAEPCGIVVILTPDGYTELDQLDNPAPVVARGTNAIVLAYTGAHPVTLRGDLVVPLHIELPPPQFAGHPNNAVGC